MHVVTIQCISDLVLLLLIKRFGIPFAICFLFLYCLNLNDHYLLLFVSIFVIASVFFFLKTSSVRKRTINRMIFFFASVNFYLTSKRLKLPFFFSFSTRKEKFAPVTFLFDKHNIKLINLLCFTVNL